MKSTMYVYPLRDNVRPFHLRKALVDVSYDKWNEAIMIEDYNEVVFTREDIELLRRDLINELLEKYPRPMIVSDLQRVFDKFYGGENDALRKG